MTNLYGAALIYPLPYELLPGFYEMTMDQIMEYNLESDLGFFVVCDIECPKELRDKFNAYPLFPTKEDGKLKVTLKKEYYCVHVLYLQFGMKLGYKVTIIYGEIWFKQRLFFKEYIELNTRLRNEAKKNKDSLGDLVYKTMNNALYGKMCQNPRKYGNWEKYNHDNPKLEVRINHPRVKQIINLYKISLIELAKSSIYFDRPIYVSVALLDISKYIMADFWYNGLKKAMGDNVVLAYTDTDSLIVGIREPNAKQIFETHSDLKKRFGTTPGGKMKVEC
jgi:hypothetical protein